MKVLMDLLAVQSESSRGRGIGRYSEELSKAILEKISKDVKIVFSSLYPEHKEEITKDYLNYIAVNKISEYDVLNGLDKSQYNSLNTLLLKKQYLNYKDIDILHHHSVFEGLSGKAEIVDNFNSMKSLNNVITLYDFIPLLFKETYLSNEDVKKWYFKKLRLIYEADYLLAISDATKEDTINVLGIPENRVTNISGAIDTEKFYKMDLVETKEKSHILTKYNINSPYIMYTGGIDFRKNIESSIRAYSKIKKKYLQKFQYVIVCKVSDAEKVHFENIIKELKIPSNKVIMTGFVSDEELNFLYNACELFIFPSIYEGFGLPVLEAMTCGKTVIGSNVSSVPEIIGRKDCMFDPTNIDDISSKINYILDNPDKKIELEKYFLDRSKEFSWDMSANLTIECYKKLSVKEDTQRVKVAFFSPLPNKKSGISDYSLELLPFLSKYMEIDIYVDNYEVEDDYLKYNFNIYSYTEFENKREEYEEIIYQFGNSEFHEYMYDIALKHSGIIVLHDFFLSGLIAYTADKQNNHQLFFDNLKYSHGLTGSDYEEKVLSKDIGIHNIIEDLPMSKKIMDSAKGVIVHSDYSKKLFKKYYYGYDYDVVKINQLIKQPSCKLISKKNEHKKLLGYKESDILITAFGHISETKQYDFILNAFSKGRLFQNKQVHLVFAGAFSNDIYKTKINKIIKKHNLQDKVKITGFVDNEIYKQYILASDIGINLRINSRGETSRALLMNMAYGLPTVINNYATFAELPDTATCKVETESEKDFIEKISFLIDNKEERTKISKNAYNYICDEHNIDLIAKEYYDFIFKHSDLKSKSENIIDEVVDIINDSNLNDILTDNEYYEIAKIVHDITITQTKQTGDKK